jgi:hypothetical protein
MRRRHFVSNAEIRLSSSALIDHVSLAYIAMGIMRELKSRTFNDFDSNLLFQIDDRLLKLLVARPSLHLIDFEQSLLEVKRLPR